MITNLGITHQTGRETDSQPGQYVSVKMRVKNIDVWRCQLCFDCDILHTFLKQRKSYAMLMQLDVNVIVYMTHSQMLGKFEYTGGPIFKVVLEC